MIQTAICKPPFIFSNDPSGKCSTNCTFSDDNSFSPSIFPLMFFEIDIFKIEKSAKLQKNLRPFEFFSPLPIFPSQSVSDFSRFLFIKRVQKPGWLFWKFFFLEKGFLFFIFLFYFWKRGKSQLGTDGKTTKRGRWVNVWWERVVCTAHRFQSFIKSAVYCPCLFYYFSIDLFPSWLV